MKISTLLQREPFEKIFITTLTKFLSEKYGKDYVVTWKKKNFKEKVNEPNQTWYCNPLINSIFVKNFDKNLFESINGEYAHNPLRPWRSIFQKLYLLFSQAKVTALFFCSYQITISPPIDTPESKLIIGGNTKLRLLDKKNQKVYVLLKDNFDKEFITKELFVRRKYPFIPLPKLYEVGKNEDWFSEEFITGKSPNRLNKDRMESDTLKILKPLKRMLKESQEELHLSDYLQELEFSYQRLMRNFIDIDARLKNEVDFIFFSILKNIEITQYPKINISFCHGDFHQGNIISGKDSIWLLDWEHSGKRQSSYDLFILLLESRIEHNYSNRFLKVYNNNLSSFHTRIIEEWSDIEWEIKAKRRFYLLVFFLVEELLFYLNENALNSMEHKPLSEKRRNEYLKIIEAINLKIEL